MTMTAQFERILKGTGKSGERLLSVFTFPYPRHGLMVYDNAHVARSRFPRCPYRANGAVHSPVAKRACCVAGSPAEPGARARCLARSGDRKSTRLNSSH